MTEKSVEHDDYGTIYLLRHGELLQEPGGRRYIGQTDLPLSPSGIRQAEQWHSFFSRIDLSAIFCSDLHRSLQTACIIAKGRPLEMTSMPELREVDLGAWEGLLFETVRNAERQAYEMRGRDPAGFRPSSGESFVDLHERVMPAFKRIASHCTGNTLIVGHAGVNRVVLCYLLGMPLNHLFRLGQDYAALNIIKKQASGVRVQAINLILGWEEKLKRAGE
jgi:broad specificity phosphatase PhoE